MKPAANTDSTAPPAALDTCPQCGKKTQPGQKFCVNCGLRLPPRGEVKTTAAPDAVRTTAPIVAARLQQYVTTQSLRALQLSIGIALRTAERYNDAADALRRALQEPGSEPPAEDVFLQLAYVYELAGSKEDELRSYLEAVRAAPKWADQILPSLHRMFTPELARPLVGWFAKEWEAAFSDTAIDPADRLHADLFLCRVHLYTGNYEAARSILERIKKTDPDQFRRIAPSMFTADSLRAAVTAEQKGDSFFALAQIARSLDQPEALSLADEALTVGMTGERNPEAPVYQLRAEILEASGATADAAQAFYEAGRRYLWRDELTLATTLLERAKSLRPDHAPTYWFSMETYRVLSYREDYPYVHPHHVEASKHDWDAGVRIAQPEAEFVWAYGSRALLNEQIANLPNADASPLNWEAVTLLERAGLRVEPDAFGWAYLARFHRYLQNHACADRASEAALKSGPDNLAALEERAILLSEQGHATGALEAIAKRRQLDSTPNVWLDALEAFNLVLRGPRDRAMELLNNAIAKAPGQLWYFALRASCYRLMDAWPEAGEDSRRIWSQYDPNDTANRSRFAWAAYYVGEYTTARDLFKLMAADPLQAANAHRGIGFSALALGQTGEAQQHLEVTVSLTRDEREFDDLLILDFHTARHLARNTPNQAAVEAVLSEVAEAVAVRRAEIAERSAEREMEDVTSDLLARDEARGWAWIGAHATLARLYGEASRWSDAAAMYQGLLPEADRFPEARVGVAKAVVNLSDSAANALKAGKTSEGQAALIHARALLETPGLEIPQESLIDLSVRSGMACFLLGHAEEARSHFHAALERSRTIGADVGTKLAEACLPFVRTATAYWALRDAWQQEAEAPTTSPLDRADLLAAAEALSPALDTTFGLVEKAALEKRLPIVTPIVLEIGSGLVPQVDPARDGGKFLFEDIRDLRSQIEAALGVKIPGVRARPSAGDVATDAYRILLDEVTVFNGKASTTAPILVQLESILRAHTAMFLGVQEADNLISDWQKTPEGAAILPSVLKTPLLKWRFMRLLRALVGEQIPITRWQDILEAVRESGLDDPARALRAVRLRLRDRWSAGPRVPRTRRVPIEWQRWIRPEEGRISFTASPADAHRLLVTIREWMEAPDPPEVLLTPSPELRHFVRQLVASDFPGLMVLSVDEAGAARDVSVKTAAAQVASAGEAPHA